MNYKKFDVIIFGASGCVGKSTVLQAIDVLKGFKWAVAGRSERKLQMTLNEISLKTGQNLNNIPIFVTNAHDVDRLGAMVEKCKIIINCCGPYQFLAENILTTCIIKGTHYVDMSNDPYFNELMEFKYHEKALEHKVYVISSCGFHSFPMEMALNFLRQHFNGTINSVEAFVRYNFGSYLYLPLHSLWTLTAWLSLIWSCSKLGDLSVIRDQLRTEAMPQLLPKLRIEELSKRSKYGEDGIMVHIPFIDQQTVERSEYMFQIRNEERPIQFCKYLEFPLVFYIHLLFSKIFRRDNFLIYASILQNSSYIWAVVFIIWCLIISFLAQFEKTRKLMNNHPKLFSFGMFSKKGPNSYLLEMSSYKIKMRAKGWSYSTKYPNLAAEDNSILDRFMNIEISGENPFYGCGSVCLLISARIILEDQERMPERGGVLSPGYAFKNINILEKVKNFSNYLRIRVL